jgi:LacI family transcriptional regulator
MDMQIPMVVLDNYMEQKQLDYVTINNELGVFQAISYLAAEGHREIGYLHIMQNANNFTERYFGYLRAMERLGLSINRNWILEMDTQGGDTLHTEVERKLSMLERMPSAFFADNDIVAICAIHALRKLGYQVPEDVSFVGFDNMALSEMTDPPLTTIQISKRQIGVEAVNSIIEKMEKRRSGNLKTEIATKLIVRQSVRQMK